ncbi:MAG: hypothetical protein AB2813_04965 [Candidatus Sedimenticola endophacoides]
MSNTKACYRITLASVTLLAMVCLQAAAAVDPGNADEAEVDSQKPVAEQRRLLAASNRSVTRHELIMGARKLGYTATAASLDVGNEKAEQVGRMFYISYTADKSSDAERPLTFVFNGGPGAASAYLHMGALGPKRAVFADDGRVLPMPASLQDNEHSWLAFTDLVFVDPIGTGYSREFPKPVDKSSGKDAASSGDERPNGRAWGVEEDVDALARFIRAYLTQEGRWLSPLYLAGESYGGLRVARLASLLQSDFGIAPSGLVLISPALDFSLLWGDERSLWPWVALLPSYTAVAAHHGQGENFAYRPESPRVALEAGERFARTGYLTGLAGGNQAAWLEQASRFTGVDAELLQRWNGRVSPSRYAKALLQEQSRLVSLYDGSISLVDPDPRQPMLSGGDPYLERLNVPVTAAFNSYVRDDLAFRTDLPYLLLNEEVFESWNWRSGIQGRQGFVEAVADLKRAMSVNPDLQVMVTHGVFDLATPYFASVIAIEQLDLDPALQANIRLKVYHGGHMPYLHQQSRLALFEDARDFYRSIP